MRGKNKGSIMTQYQFEKEEKERIKIREYFLSEEISPDAAIFTLRLLGFSVTRAKQIVRQWINEKSNGK